MLVFALVLVFGWTEWAKSEFKNAMPIIYLLLL